MSNEFDERQEVIERKEGYYWNVSVQLGKSSERVKAKAGGNEQDPSDLTTRMEGNLSTMPEKVKEAHDNLTKEQE